jgi:hypothetical protein
MHPAVLRWPSGRSPLIIYKAKMSSLDAGCYIDIQLACGAGLEPTKAFLRESSEPDAKELLAVLEDGKYAGTLKASRPNGISIFIGVPTGSRRSASRVRPFPEPCRLRLAHLLSEMSVHWEKRSRRIEFETSAGSHSHSAESRERGARCRTVLRSSLTNPLLRARQRPNRTLPTSVSPPQLQDLDGAQFEFEVAQKPSRYAHRVRAEVSSLHANPPRAVCAGSSQSKFNFETN